MAKPPKAPEAEGLPLVRWLRNISFVVLMSLLYTVVLLTPRAAAAQQAPGPIVISEFVAANHGGHDDEDGESSDWIELRNDSGSLVDITGWTLTDDVTEPSKWTFPSTSIAGGERLVIFASGKDRAVSGNELHTNFKLDAAGSYLAVVQSNGSTIADAFSPGYPVQISNVSYGRTEGGAAQTNYFAVPTPGAPNGPPSSGLAEPVTVSLAHGFYTTPQTVTLSTPTGGAVIRYTLDGSEPSASNGITYSSALTVNTTTTLRAAAVRPGYLTVEIATATYLFVNDIVAQSATPPDFPVNPINGQAFDYEMDPAVVAADQAAVTSAMQAIPTISVVTDLDNLFDPDAGIYVNASKRGSDWERPVSVELIDPTGAGPGFAIDAGIRIRGGSSRAAANPKHSLRFLFKAEYGGELEYPLFEGEGAQTFANIDLRTSQRWNWSFRDEPSATYIEELWSRDTQRAMGHPYTRSRAVHVYLNGVYWGLYQTEERINAAFGESYLGGNKDDFDVVKRRYPGAAVVEAPDGTVDGFVSLFSLVEDLQVTNSEYDAIAAQVDLVNLADYYLLHFFSGDFDNSPTWYGGEPFSRSANWYAIRNRNGIGQAAGWQFLDHDSEQSLCASSVGGGPAIADENVDNTPPWNLQQNPSAGYMAPAWLHEALVSHPDYRRVFASRVWLHMLTPGGALTAANNRARFDARAEELAGAILAESARWGDGSGTTTYGVAEWIAALDLKRTCFDLRPAVVEQQLRSDGLWPDTLVDLNAAPTVAAPTPQASLVGDPLSLAVSATDPDGDALIWTAIGLPNGLTIDPDSGVIAGTVAGAGSFAVTVAATDLFGKSDSASFGWVTAFPLPSRVILNEWNAVASDALLKNGGSDSFFGTVAGNGGDWFELVTIEDDLDIRGWTLEISDKDNAAGLQTVTDVFEFAQSPLLASLRAGTIITVAEQVPDDPSYDPAAGDWNLNFQANSGDAGAFFTAASQSNFAVTHTDWQLVIRDAFGSAVFGPAGEGRPATGVGNTEIGELEADPSDSVTSASPYGDGSSSTFGDPNDFGGRAQDFSLIRPQFAATGDVNCNQSLQVTDALIIAQYLAGLRTDSGGCPLADNLTQINAEVADVNGDDRVGITDALLIAQCIVGLPNVFCP